MSDIFHEVDEDLRRDRAKALWDKYGIYVLGLAVAIVVVTAGVRGWQYWQETRAQASGDRYLAALQLIDEDGEAEAGAAFAAPAADGSGDYPALAKFGVADAKLDAGDFDGAAKEFDAIATGGTKDALLADIALLRAAMILVDHGDRKDVESRLLPLAHRPGAGRVSARATLGLAAWKAGDFAAAQKHYSQLLGDPAAPEVLRQRADLALAVITSQGGPTTTRRDDD